MDETYPLQGIGEYIPETAQYLFVTATLPDSTNKQIVREFSTDYRQIMTIKGPGLHRIPPTIEEVLIDCSIKRDSRFNERASDRQVNKGNDRDIDDDNDSEFDSELDSGKDNQKSKSKFRSMYSNKFSNTKLQQKQYAETVLENKRQALLTALSMNYKIERTLIFCNTIDQCRFVENSLQRVDRNKSIREVLTYHSAIDAQVRDYNLELFSKKLLPKPVVLICTDRASRGIDFNQINVDHVILFDFPQEPSEYVRRVGRTGRCGRFGKVSILAHGRQIEVITNLLLASKQGKRIDPIPSLNSIQSYSKE